MFGGFFGDAVDVIAKTSFGVQLAEGQSLLPALWFVPLKDPMRMLMYSMLLDAFIFSQVWGSKVICV